MTRFTLILSCYNYAQYLDACLDSVDAQNYPQDRLEVICVDDGSTDETPRILAERSRRRPNLRVITQPNGGLEKACNAGIRAASSEWVIRLDSDDILSPGFLAAMDEAVRSEPRADFYYCGAYEEFYSVDESYFKTVPPFDAEEIFGRGDFFATGTVYRKADLEACGLFPEGIPNCGLENYAVILALLTLGKRGRMVPKASFRYRRHHTNMSTLRRAALIQYGHRLLARYGRPFVTNEHHPYGLKLETAV